MAMPRKSLVPCLLLVAALLAGCRGSDATPPEASGAAFADNATATPLTGVHAFEIVPEESRAAYIANEEFFSLALTKFGIPAGWAEATGSTQAVEGRFQLDADKPGSWLGENEFAVRMNTFTSDRDMRDNWIRENGPRFNDYPLATFKATAIDGGPSAYQPGEEFAFTLPGTLTIRQISHPATFAVTARLSGNTLSGTATTRLLMSSYGIETITFFDTLTVADELVLRVDFVARSSAPN
jgi:polyisoprenoid-binding protein YceI